MPRKKAEPKTVTKTARKTVKKGATQTVAKAEPKTTAKRATRTATKTAKAAPKVEPQVEPKVESKAESKIEASAASITPSPVPLTGADLVKKIKELGNLSKEEKAKACGYYAMTKNGLERVNMMKFLNALIDAEGIDLDSKGNDINGRGGRSASYKITVQSNGNLLIGAAYTKQMDLKPGDEFKITLGRKHIRLTQVGSEVDEEE